MPPPQTDAGLPRWMMLCGLGLVVLCFGVGYHWGSKAEDAAVEQSEREVLHHIQVVVRDANACVKRRDSILKKMSKANNQSSTYEALEAAKAEYNRLNDDEKAAQTNYTECDERHKKAQVDLMHDEDHARDRIIRLNALQDRLKNLTDQIAAVKGEAGMRRALLLESLKQAREKHLRLSEELGDHVILDDAYEVDLEAQFRPKKSQNITADSIARMMDANAANISVAKFIARWSNFTYNASLHTNVFIPRNAGPDAKEPIERPKWFDREGAAPEVLGVVIGNITAPITTTAYAIKSLTTVAMCAYRHNNSNLTFPNKFRRVDSLHRVEALQDTVETPLVTYCRQCVNAIAQPAFRLACSQDRPNRIYGGYDFWAARSMIRPTPAVIESARAKFLKNNLAGRNILGVAFKNSPQLRMKCNNQRKPQRHYMWARALANRTNETLFEAVPGANRTEQCQPGIPTLFAAVDALRSKFKFDVVIVSVETPEQKELVQNTEFGGATQVIALRPDSAFEDMEEIVLTSWANHILVNRFSDHSQVLTEAFALRNGIQAKKIHFF